MGVLVCELCVYDVGKSVNWCMNNTLVELLHGQLANHSADSKVNMSLSPKISGDTNAAFRIGNT